MNVCTCTCIHVCVKLMLVYSPCLLSFLCLFYCKCAIASVLFTISPYTMYMYICKHKNNFVTIGMVCVQCTCTIIIHMMNVCICAYVYIIHLHWIPKLSASVKYSLARPDHCLVIFPTCWVPSADRICREHTQL